jgi:hypothetical protein
VLTQRAPLVRGPSRARGAPPSSSSDSRRVVPLSCQRSVGHHRPMVDYTHTIDRWDEATGETLIERIAGVSDYLVAVETYRAAVKRWPGAKITLRNRTRVIEQSWEI